MKAIVAYVPVLHKGYFDLFERHQKIPIFLITPSIIEQLDEDHAEKLLRDFRALPVRDVESFLCCYYSHYSNEREVSLISRLDEMEWKLKPYSQLVFPKDDLGLLLEKSLPGKHILWDTTFLRWDWSNTTAIKEVLSDRVITTEDPIAQKLVLAAKEYAQESSDWWRQVAAIAVKEGKELFRAYNRHMPTDEAPYIDGDPRSNLNAGGRGDICNAIHAEASIISQAAREGISLKGADIFVTTFPCRGCAMSIKEAGINRVFFLEGYSTLDADQILKDAGIEIIKVLLK